MSRAYSDPSYGSKKVMQFAFQGTAGTRATAVVDTITPMHRIRVTDWEMINRVLGTGGSSQWVLAATSSAGTSALGTIIFVGTHAANVLVSGSVTETPVAAGGVLNLYSVLQTAAVELAFTARVEYKEAFDNADTD